MNYIEQIKAFFDSGIRSFALISLALSSVILFDLFFEDLFQDLPNWILPTIYVFTIISWTALIYSIFAILIKKPEHIPLYNKITLSVKLKRIYNNLMNLSPEELFVISAAKSKESRGIWLNSDSKLAIDLLEKGLIRERFIFTESFDTPYEIEYDAWKIIISLDAFYIDDKQKKILSHTHKKDWSEEEVLFTLPRKHPVTKSLLENG